MFIFNNSIIKYIIMFFRKKTKIPSHNNINKVQINLIETKKNNFDDWKNYIIKKAETDALNAYKNILKFNDNILLTDNMYINRNYLLKNLGEYYKEPIFNSKYRNRYNDELIDMYYKNFCNNIIYYYNNFDDIHIL